MSEIYCSEVSQRVLPSNGNFQPLEDSRKTNGSLENCKQYKNRAILLVSRRVKITHSGYKTDESVGEKDVSDGGELRQT